MSAQSWNLACNRVIEASAGTGKTYTIAGLVCRLVAEQDLQAGSLLITTFTKASASELRERVRERLASEALVSQGQARARLERALNEIDQATITTIHSFCQRVLTELPFESGADIGRGAVEDPQALQSAVLADAWAEVVAPLQEPLASAVGLALGQKEANAVVKAALAHPDLPLVPQPGAGPISANPLRDVEAQLQALSSATELAGFSECMRANSVPGRILKSVNPFTVRSDVFMDFTAALPKYDDASVGKAVLTAHKSRAPEIVAACNRLRALRAAIESASRSVADEVRARLAAAARRSAAARKKRDRVMTFDDMVHDVRRALRGKDAAALRRSLAGRYRAVLVDEFQDTDRAQAEVFSGLFAQSETRVFYIGDPKQSIYRFRGADIDAYVQATRPPRFEGESSVLDTNYRTDRALLDSVQALMEFTPGGSIAGAPGDMPEIGIPRVHAKYAEARMRDKRGNACAGLHVHVAGKGAAEALDVLSPQVFPRVAEAIRQELMSGSQVVDRHTGAWRPLVPGDVAILLRSNSQLASMQRALRRKGIPSVLKSRESVWQSDEAAELLRVLAALASPADLTLRRSAAATELAGLDSDAVRTLGAVGDDGDAGADDANAGGGDAHDVAVTALSAWLLGLQAELERNGPVPFVRKLLDTAVLPQQEPARLRLLSRAGGERSVTNVVHLSELLGRAWRDGVRSAGELAAHLAAERARYAEGRAESEDMEQRIESDGSAVQLLTVHGSKGLEWPVVWLPLYALGMWTPKPNECVAFPTVSDGQEVLAVGGPLRDAAAAENADEETRESFRLLYVALTRARHRCNVVWAKAHNAENGASPLAAVLHGRHAASAAEATEAAKRALKDPASALADLRALQTRARSDGLEGFVELVPLAEKSNARWRADAQSTPLEPPRVLRAEIARARITTSFTGLTRGAHEAEVVRVRQDDAERGEQAATEPSTAAPLLTREVLPAGPEYGDLVHRVLERAIERSLTLDALTESAQQMCRGSFASVNAELLARGLHSMAQQPLGGSLGGAALAQLINPMARTEFSYIAAVGGSVAQIADAMAQGDAIAKRYAAVARGLTAQSLRGFMVGFMDLVCQQQGRWYVIDYKTNALGTTLDAFAPAALEDAMVESHYVLQYHLYALAMHRWLRTRIAQYDYEKHFGGALYLFVRAMGAQRPAGAGVFADRPSLRTMQALDSALAAPQAPQMAPNTASAIGGLA